MSSSTDFKTLEIPVDGVNSYIPPIIINEADNDGRNLKFIPLQDGQPVTGFTSARLYYDPRPKDAYSVGGYIDGTQDGDGWTFVIPANTFTADTQGNGSVSFTDSDGETYTRNIQFLVESGGTKALSQGSKIDQLVALLQSMVNDFTMTAEAETGPAGSQANVTVTLLPSGAYNLNFTIPQGVKGDHGDAGSVEIGSTTTGEPGSEASVSNSGNTKDAILNFTIPRGDKGDTGKAATIEIGTVTTGNAGTNASVQNVGTSTDARLNFTIPRGDKGDPGDLTTVAHDDTLTGDGTSGALLGVADGTAINNFIHNTVPLNIDEIMDNGFHGINTSVQADSNVFNAPDDIYSSKLGVRAFMIVSSCGYANTSSVKKQIWFNRGVVPGEEAIYVRCLYNAGWSSWSKIAFTSDIPDLSNYVPLSTYKALEAKVQALETKTKIT